MSKDLDRKKKLFSLNPDLGALDIAGFNDSQMKEAELDQAELASGAYNGMGWGAGIGGLIGAAGGAILGSELGEPVRGGALGMFTGGALGGLAGTLLGKYLTYKSMAKDRGLQDKYDNTKVVTDSGKLALLQNMPENKIKEIDEVSRKLSRPGFLTAIGGAAAYNPLLGTSAARAINESMYEKLKNSNA